MQSSWKLWAAAGLSAGLLELPFPVAGPLPPWRAVFAWAGLVPLLWALLSSQRAEGHRPLRHAFFLAYLCGVLWYAGNCYWIRDTMQHYGDMPPLAPELLTLGFSLVLGLYFGLFGLCLALLQRATNSTRMALIAAPFLWTGLDLAAARITSVPWDQLGYSQVDNGIMTLLAPWTGVYGISFIIVAVNALTAAFCTPLYLALQPKNVSNRMTKRVIHGLATTIIVVVALSSLHPVRTASQPTSTAVLIQPNLDVGGAGAWPGAEWDRHIADFLHLASEPATVNTTYIAGIPQTGAPLGEIVPPPYPTHPDLVVWPESPAPFVQGDPRFDRALAMIATTEQAPLIVGGVGEDVSREDQSFDYYNSAIVESADGHSAGRYDKIHLVPFGEYIPFQNLLTFAHKLTGRVSSFTRGGERNTFLLSGHRYGIFICYESVFADEVRQFARNGAEVFVNISDDGWYGDTSAPWQHLNMVRMRAIENRRWILRDTNNGITAAIDPYGRVRQSIPRHRAGELPAEFGFRDDVTFYSAHGDVFAWLCVILSIGVVGWSITRSETRKDKPKA